MITQGKTAWKDPEGSLQLLMEAFHLERLLKFQFTAFEGVFPRGLSTLKSLIEEHAPLDFSDFLSTLLAIFHVINEKFHPARLLIYLVNKQAGWHFFPSLLF